METLEPDKMLAEFYQRKPLEEWDIPYMVKSFHTLLEKNNIPIELAENVNDLYLQITKAALVLNQDISNLFCMLLSENVALKYAKKF